MDNRKVILFDGPHGMTLWDKAEKYGYEKKPVWMYNLEHPEIVEELDREYVAAGSRIVLANTFAANGPAVAAASSYQTREIILAGLEITKRACAGSDVMIGFAVGPVSEMLEPYGELEEEECLAIFEEMMAAGEEGGAQMVYIQTFMDLNMMKLAVQAAKRHPFRIFASMTYTKSGKTMFGNSVADVVRELTPFCVDAIGINCELGPKEMLPMVKEYHELTDIPLVVKANALMMKAAGGSGQIMEPSAYLEEIKELLPYVSVIGGCCGADPRHIALIGKKLRGQI